MPKIGQISRPWRGTRGHDSWGDGGFGASRSGGVRKHKGVDFVCAEGDVCLAPFDGIISRVGRAYADATLGSIHVQGTGIYWAYYAKILYAEPTVLKGKAVKRGDVIGICQNVSAYHGKADPERPGMTNHLHLELRVITDAQYYMETPQCQNGPTS